MLRALLVSSIMISVSMLGCAASSSGGSPDSGGTGGGGGGGGSAPGSTSSDNEEPFDPGTMSPGTGGPIDEGACGRQDFDVARKPADIMLVLDRSASMKKDPAGGSSTPSKWDIVVPALQQVITATDAAVSWGLKVFPEGEGTGTCTTESFPSDILIPLAMSNAATVNQAISKTTDEGDGTPTGDAINKAVEYMQTIKNDHVKYLLLATDGDPSCPSSDAEGFAVKAVTTAASAGFHTFVVGVASSASKIKTLNSLAVAGLEPRVDPDPLAPKFYLAATQGQLVTALQAITGAVSTCLFPLSSPPPNPAHVGVFIGDKEVMKDTTGTDGWDYTGPDTTAIKLSGAACDQVESSGVGTVKVIFGCKDDPIY